MTDSLAPKWLTKDYIESVLRKYKEDNALQVVSLDIQPATAKGENYASVMTRIKVQMSLDKGRALHQGSYIVKTSFEHDPILAKIMSGYDVYNTEMLMYEKVLPQLSQLLSEIGDDDKLFADTVHVDYEHSAIIFEDLAVLNFGVGDRLVGFDRAHAEMALKKLAKMHAAAAVLDEKQPGVLTKFDRGIHNRHTRAFSVIFEHTFEVCADFAGECPVLGEYYKNKLLKLKPRVMEYACRVIDQHKAHFHTLNHGDFWINNTMLRYGPDHKNGGKSLNDLLIIDFQFSAWVSPAVDLHYFFLTSLEPELKFQHLDAFVQYYHRILSETLAALHYAGHIPTLHEFHLQMEAGGFYAVISALTCQAVLINDKTDDADFAALMVDDGRGRAFRRLLYTNKRLQESLKFFLPIFDRKGLLDVYD